MGSTDSYIGQRVRNTDPAGIVHEGVIVSEDHAFVYVRSTNPAFAADGLEWHYKIKRTAVERYIMPPGAAPLPEASPGE